jgi:hypothetical protein
MTKAKRGTKENPIRLNGEDLLKDERELVIKSCVLKDDKPVYSFEKLKNPGKGDTENVKGAALVVPDMHKAFKKLNVHLACIDDAFKNADIQFESISKMHSEDLTQLYSVYGFKIKGKKDDEKVSLIGKKYLSVGGYGEIETPEVLMAEFSAYKWWNELKTAIDKCRHELELYRDGKCEVVEEIVDDPSQIALDLKEGNNGVNDQELEGARVK